MTGYYIFPFNGNCLEVIDTLDTKSCLGIIDDFSTKSEYSGIKIFKRNELKINNNSKLLYLYGSLKSLHKRRETLENLGFNESQSMSFIDKSCTIGKSVKLGKGVFMLPGVRVTSNAKIGKFVGVLHNSVIHHDVCIGDYTLVASNVVITGGCEIGKNCYIGAGSKIKPGIIIEDNSVIGMGSVVVKNVKSGSTVFGVPAKEYIK